MRASGRAVCRLVHQAREQIEQIPGVVRPGCSLRMVLDRERRDVQETYPLGGHIVEVHVRELHPTKIAGPNDGRDARSRPRAEVAGFVREVAVLVGVELTDRAEVDAEAVVLARDLDL